MTKPRLSQARALLFHKFFVTLWYKIKCYAKFAFSLILSKSNGAKKCQHFTEIDKQNALAFAKELWSDSDTVFVTEYGLELLKPIRKQTTTIHRSVPRYNYPTIEELEAKRHRRNWAIRRNYAKKASSSRGRKNVVNNLIIIILF